MVVVLVETQGMKQDEPWRLQNWAWSVRGLKRETFMLNSGILFLSFQSWCFKNVHGIEVLARGTWFGFKGGWWCTFSFISKLRWNERRYKLHLLEWVMVGLLLRLWIFGTKDRSGRSNCSQLFIKAPMGRFFFDRFFNGVAYENIKLKDGKDVEIYENLNFVNYDWDNPTLPQHSKKSPDGLSKSLLVKTSGI